MLKQVGRWLSKITPSKQGKMESKPKGTKRKRQQHAGPAKPSEPRIDFTLMLPEGVLTHVFQLMSRLEGGMPGVRSSRLVCKRWRLAATEVLLEDTAASKPPPPAMACKSATTGKDPLPTQAATLSIPSDRAEGGVEVSSLPKSRLRRTKQPALPLPAGMAGANRAARQQQQQATNAQQQNQGAQHARGAQAAGPGWLPSRQPRGAARRTRAAAKAVPEGGAESEMPEVDEGPSAGPSAGPSRGPGAGSPKRGTKADQVVARAKHKGDAVRNEDAATGARKYSLRSNGAAEEQQEEGQARRSKRRRIA